MNSDNSRDLVSTSIIYLFAIREYRMVATTRSHRATDTLKLFVLLLP
jgi:hypothetical protein